MIRVLYVFMRFPVPSEAFAAAEVKALGQRGVGVSVGCMRAEPRNARQLLSERGLDDLKVSYSDAKAWARGLRVLLSRPIAALRALRTVLVGTWKSPRECLASLVLLPRAFDLAEESVDDGVDVVHLFWGHYPSLVALAIRELGCGTRVSISLGAYDLVREFPLSKIASQEGLIVTHAEANRTSVARVCGVEEEDVHVVYRGVVVPPDPGPVCKSARILVVERLIAPKRTIDSLRAFSKVAPEYPDVALDVLGDGPERATLEAWVQGEGLEDRVRFCGHMPHKGALARMGGAGVLLSMSQSPGERLPNVVKEAMARRCACVVTRTPGIEELVGPGDTGYIVEPGDVDAASDRLREILGDEVVMARMGEHGRRHVKESFDLEKTTMQRIEIWESMLGDGKGGAGIGER